MSRNYVEPIHVRVGGRVLAGAGAGAGGRCDAPGAQEGSPDPGLGDGGAPSEFLWRGRLYVVRAILAHWLESASWWGGSRIALEGAIPPHEREVWRVEAQSGRSSQPGVYDICRDAGADRWVLARAMD